MADAPPSAFLPSMRCLRAVVAVAAFAAGPALLAFHRHIRLTLGVMA